MLEAVATGIDRDSAVEGCRDAVYEEIGPIMKPFVAMSLLPSLHQSTLCIDLGNGAIDSCILASVGRPADLLSARLLELHKCDSSPVSRAVVLQIPR